MLHRLLGCCRLVAAGRLVRSCFLQLLRRDVISSQVKAGFDLKPEGTGTRVHWQGEAQVFGRLASMAGGLLEPLGKKNVQKLIAGLQAALDQQGEKGR